MGLRVEVLGTLRASDEDSGPMPLRLGRRERAVLTLLALHGGRVVTTDRLIDELWPERPPDRAANTVQVYVSRIRRALGANALRRDHAGYALNIDPHGVDVARLEALAERGRRASAAGRYSEASDLLRQGLAMWDGEFIEGSELPSVGAEAVRLRELRLSALEECLEADVALGRGPDIVPEIQAAAERHPLRERLQICLLIALFQAGRQDDALRAFAAHRATCVEELGMEPGSELQRVHQSILMGSADLTSLASPFGRIVRSLGSSASVPTPPAPLVGRDRELAQLTTGLVDLTVRLITLTGPGGIGKSRLAVEAAHEVVDSFPDGIYFVPLATVTSAEVMHATVAEVMDLPPESRTVPALYTHLAYRSCLLVLDNLEQLGDAPEVVSEILAASPSITVLATSRRPLHLVAEHEQPLPPLPLAGPGLGESPGAAVELFVQRALMVVPEFRATPDDTDAIREICRRLDGLPLAIELAAARTKLLSPQALLRRLDQALDIQDHAADRPVRQRTLRDTINWSYRLLDDRRQALFRTIGVFAGGADLESISEVAADLIGGEDTVDVVMALVDASLLTVSSGTTAEPRIRMLETIRSFANAELAAHGEVDEVSRRHAQHFVSMAQLLTPLIDGPEAVEVRGRLERESENVRAALQWLFATFRFGESLEHDRVRTGVAFALTMWPFWIAQGYFAESRQWMETALALSARSPGEATERARCMSRLATTMQIQGELLNSLTIALEAAAICRKFKDAEGLAMALQVAGQSHAELGDLASSRRAFKEGCDVSRRSGLKRRLIHLLSDLAIVEGMDGNLERAVALDRQCLEIARQIGDQTQAAVSHLNTAAALQELGRLTQAREMLEELFVTYDQQLATDQTIAAAESYACILSDLGLHRSAARLMGAADAMRDRLAVPRPARFRDELRVVMTRGRKELSRNGWEATYAEGRAQDLQEAIRAVREAAT
jgi:predicted ATPase/DNA-binding SARP family transcriptional activator